MDYPIIYMTPDEIIEAFFDKYPEYFEGTLSDLLYNLIENQESLDEIFLLLVNFPELLYNDQNNIMLAILTNYAGISVECEQLKKLYNIVPDKPVLRKFLSNLRKYKDYSYTN